MNSISRWKAVLCSVAVAVPMLAAGELRATEAVDLAGGFQWYVAGFEASGAVDAAGLVSGCPGQMGAEAALEATVSDIGEPLGIYAVGEGVSGVLVAGPDGIHHCDAVDVYGIAHVHYERVLAGTYKVWPLAATAGATVSGSIVVGEYYFGPRDIVGLTGFEVDPALLPPLISEQPLAPGAEPAAGRLALPDAGTAELAVTLSGGVPASDASAECSGDINQMRPDATLTLAAPEPMLAIAASAAGFDTTLLVVAPDGTIFCNDDATNYDPAIVLSGAAAGDYAIWVGVRGSGAGEEARLVVGREPPEGVGAAAPPATLPLQAEPAYGRFELPAEGAIAVEAAIVADESRVFADQYVSGCNGAIDPSRPDAIVTIPGPEARVWFGATASDADLTLLVVGPDGGAQCNDDHAGANPAVELADAQAGDYAVWIGVFAGGGATATLTVGREPPGGEAFEGPAEPAAENPFAGQDLQSAAQALAILISAMRLEEALTYASLEETGPDGLILHDVVLRDPEGVEPPLQIGRVSVSHLDLAGLSANGVPETFRLVVEDLVYASVVDGARANAVPLPALADQPPLGIEISLLPVDGDPGKREVRFGFGLEGHLALSVGARLIWPDGAGAMGPAAMDAVQGESLAIELHDMGFLAALFDEIAAESGQTRAEAIQGALDDLEAMLGPVAPGSAAQRFHDMVSARFADLERPGVLRASIDASSPLPVEAMMQGLADDAVDPAAMTVEMSYTPDP
jgi:hypothetical protein